LSKGLGRTKHAVMYIKITHSRQMALLSLLVNGERTLGTGLPEISRFVYVIERNQRLTTNRVNIWPRSYQLNGTASLNNRKTCLSNSVFLVTLMFS